MAKVIKVWFVWFWHLSTAGKVAVTAAEIVGAWLVLPHIPQLGQFRTTIVEFGSIGLCFLLIGGILFSQPGRS